MIIVAKPLVADSARLKSAYVKKFNFYVNLASLSSKLTSTIGPIICLIFPVFDIFDKRFE